VAGEPDVLDLALGFRLPDGLERAAVAGNRLQFLLVLEAVDLVEVDRPDAQGFERGLQPLFGALVLAFLGLAPEEDLLAVLVQLRRELRLGVAVGRGDVEVVDARERASSTIPFAPSCSSQFSAMPPKETIVLRCPVSPSGRVSIPVFVAERAKGLWWRTRLGDRAGRPVRLNVRQRCVAA